MSDINSAPAPGAESVGDVRSALFGAPQASFGSPDDSQIDAVFPHMINQESGGRQLKADGTPVTSSRGAIGIAQVMPKTAPEAAQLAGLPYDEQRYRTDTDYNKALGRAYLAQQVSDFGSIDKGLAAYNAGPDAMNRALARATKAGTPDAWLQYLPAETQAYVPAILHRAGPSLQQAQPGKPAAAGGSPDAYYQPSGDQPYTLHQDPAPGAETVDYMKELAASAMDAVGSIGQAAGEVGAKLSNEFTGTNNYVGKNVLRAPAESLRDTMSPGGKAAVADSQVQGDLSSVASGDTSGLKLPTTGSGWGMLASNLFGMLAPTLIPVVGQAGKAAQLSEAANALNTAIKVKDFATAAKLAGVADEAGIVAKAAQLTQQANSAATAVKATGAAVQGGMVGGGAAESARQRATQSMAGMTHDQLMANVPAYAEAFSQTNDDTQARDMVANSAAQWAAGLSAIAGAGAGAVNAKVLHDIFVDGPMSKLVGNTVASRAGRTAIGAAGGAVTGATEGVAMQVGQNAGENIGMGQSATQNVTRDTMGQAVGGAMLGAGGGAAVGVKSHPDAAAPAVVPPGMEKVAEKAAEPNSPMSKAAMASAAAAANDPARIAAEAQAKSQAEAAAAPKSDPLSDRAAQISDAMRQNGALDALRAEGSPVTVQNALKDLAIAQSASTPTAAREQAIGRLEYALQWSGIDVPERGAQAAPQVANEVAKTGAPFAPSIQPKQAAAQDQAVRAAASLLNSIDRSGKPADPNRVNDVAEALGIPVDPAAKTDDIVTRIRQAFDDATREPEPAAQSYDTSDADQQRALVEQQLAQGNEQAAARVPQPPPVASVVDAARVEPMARTAEQTAIMRQAESRYTPEQLDLIKKAATYPAGMSADEKLRFKQLREEQEQGKQLGAEAAAAVKQQEQNSEPKAGSNVPNLGANEANLAAPVAIKAPRVATPPGEGSAVLRKRRATLRQLVEMGLSRVDRTADGFVLTDGKREFKLEGPADAQLARAEIKRWADEKAGQADTEATAAQKLANNAKKGDVIKAYPGVDFIAENPAGSVRVDLHHEPPEWQSQMLDHYGDIAGTVGADGDKVDAFWSGRGNKIFVIDQVDRAGEFDEHKVVLRARDEKDARDTYLRNYEKGWTGLGSITEMTPDAFRAWVHDKKATQEPLGDLKNGAAGHPDDATGGARAEGRNPDAAAGVADRGAGGVGPDGRPADAAAGVPDSGTGAAGHAPDAGAGSDVTVQVKGKKTRLKLVKPEDLGKESLRRGARGKQLSANDGAMLQRLARLMGKEVIFFDDPKAEIGEGFVSPGNDKNVFVNSHTGVHPMAIVGHEMWHLIRREMPETWDSVAQVVRAHLKDDAPHQFRNDYHRADEGPNSNHELGDRDIEELTSDIGGNLMADQKFWREVFDQIDRDHGERSKGLIAAIADFFYGLVDRIVKGMKGYQKFRATDFVDEMKDVRAAFREGLAKYIAENGITRTAMQAEILRAGAERARQEAANDDGGIDPNSPDITRSTKRDEKSDNASDEQRARAESSETGSRNGAPPVYGTAQPGSVSAVGVHFSKQPRTRLDSIHYGTGAKGLEAERLIGRENDDIRPRTFFYVDKGNGVNPEAGVGGAAHRVQLNNLYDVQKDPLGIVKNNPGPNNWERAVARAGFDGYLNNDPKMPQAYAVLVGKHENVPVERFTPPGFSEPVVSKESTSRALMSKEMNAIDTSKIPGATLRNGTLTVPNEGRDAANAEMERIGSPVRFSPARLEDAPVNEFDAIERKYRGTPQWMKAPNGEPTKLDSRQWVHVRTDAFKKWFGDWEAAHAKGGVWHVPEGEVSKAVHDNGEPLVVYHGSDDAGFAEFERPSGKQRGDLGIFTTDDWQTARSYVTRGRSKNISEDHINDDGDKTPGVYALFINLRKPSEDSFEGAHWTGDRHDQFNVILPHEEEPFTDPQGNRNFDEETAKKVAVANNGDVVPAESHWGTTDDAVREARRMGADGAIIRDVVDPGSGADVYVPATHYVAFDPSQVKSADFNNGEYSVSNDDIRMSPARPDAQEIAKPVLRYLKPEERAKLRRDTAETLVKTFSKLPSGNEMAAIAHAGRAKRGWYAESAKALEHVFGHDSPRFAALLAAMSPQTSVETNLRNALYTWKSWIAEGRPTSRGAIVDIMGRSVEGNKLTDSVLPAWIPNSVRALTTEDPSSLVISGPKVNSFALNLRGVVDEVTNDAWMANFAAVDQKIFAGGLSADGRDPGKTPGYMAMSARVRQAADILSKLTEEKWTPAEVQETIWSWAKTLYELQDKDMGARELLDNKAVTDDLIASTPDFSSQLHEERNEDTLQRAGYGDQLSSLRGRADSAAARNEESGARGQAGPFDPETQDRHERRAASRLEQLRDDRLAAERAKAAGGADEGSVPGRGDVQRSPERMAEPSGPDQGPGRDREEDGSLRGLPRTFKVAGKEYTASHWPKAEDVARSYMRDAKLEYNPPSNFVKVDVERAKRIAAAYDEMRHDPADPAVKAAYDALAKEVEAQYAAIMKSGLKVEFIDYAKDGDPYAASPRLAIEDIRNNNHMWVFNTRDGFGTGEFDPSASPMLGETQHEISGQKALVNDLFRVVHDYFGHVKEGVGFRADGEENAWRAHMAMLSPEAQRAVTTETRGQNSWVNYGPKGEENRTASGADTVYADQKVGLLPDWAVKDGAKDVVRSPARDDERQNSPQRPTFRSDLEHAVESIPERLKTMSAPQWKLWLDANAGKYGVKRDEIEWSGIKDYLNLRGKDKVTRDELADFVRENGVQVKEVVLGEDASKVSAGTDFVVEDEDGNVLGSFNERWQAQEMANGHDGAVVVEEANEEAPGESGATKFGQYTLPGGENYREVLITLPSRSVRDAHADELQKNLEASPLANDPAFRPAVQQEIDRQRSIAQSKAEYRSSHWDEPNVLAHLRIDDRTDAEGKKVLFINEIQSDWAQEGRKNGFGDKRFTIQESPIPAELAEKSGAPRWASQDGGKYLVFKPDGSFLTSFRSKEDAERHVETANSGGLAGFDPAHLSPSVPRGPFVEKTDAWVSLAMKRAIMMAIENGQDKVAWVKGEQAADFFDLSKSVEYIQWNAGVDDARLVTMEMKGGEQVGTSVDKHGVIYDSSLDGAEGKRLEDVVGKEVAEKIMAKNDGSLRGVQLKVGGEGMRAFYDKIVPQVANDVLKRIGGGKVGEVEISDSHNLSDEAAAMKAARANIPDAEWFALSPENRQERLRSELASRTKTQPGFDITPAMREALEGGAPLFSPARGGDDEGGWQSGHEPADDEDARTAWSPVGKQLEETGAPWEPIKPSIHDDSVSPADPRSTNASVDDIVHSPVRDLAVGNGYKVSDLIDSSKKVSWWDKTVGTPYHLAEKHPPFKKVYDAIQDFIGGVNNYATRAHDLAPNILPKLEDMKDIFKSPLSAKDVKDLADPIFKGTLSYARDAEHNPVLTDDVGSAGVVWTDDELKNMWHLDDRQIALYREFRKTTNKSVADMATTHMVKFAGSDGDGVRGRVLAAPTVKEASEILADHLGWLAANDPGRADLLQNTARTVKEIADMARGLMAKGYAPLSRFGEYTVYVTRGDEQVYFGMYETQREANRAARAFSEDPTYKDATVKTGTMSQDEFKLFKGITPETLALFGEALGLHEGATDRESQVFQTMLQLAKTNRSAMKHMIERKGVAGYSEDVGRVLAQFVYSNARQASTNIHSGEIVKHVSEVPDGDLKDQAIRLMDYVNNPAQEAQALRGMLFSQYIGGSIASAAVNLTQSLTTTWPTLSMHFGVGKSARFLADALGVVKNGAGADSDLGEAMAKAAKEGITAPQETHQLLAQAQGRASLKSGDGTQLGNTLAKLGNSVAKVGLVWGKAFGFAEIMNRQIAFAAAYKLAREKGMGNPYEFAKDIVAQTQFVMNKGNNPVWARGPVGATLFTFKKFTINYLEGLSRMWGNGPEGKKAFALSLGIIFMMAGVGGFPFASNIDDVIDGLAQRVLNKSFNSKQARLEFFTKLVGDAGAQFVTGGISSLPGVPMDFSGRMGLGQIVPGTGLLTKKQDYTQDVIQIGGAAASMAQRTFQGGAALAEGNVGQAVQSVVPVAIANALKAKDMIDQGAYRDTKGRKVIDTTVGEALLKGIGFQPSSVANLQQAGQIQQSLIAQNRIRSQEISDLWTQGRVERDPAKVADAQRQLAEWNKENPDSPIQIHATNINTRVREAMMTKAQRLEKAAPKGIRADVKAALEAAQQ